MRVGVFMQVLLIVIGISFLLDWYVFNGLKTLTAAWRSDRLRLGVRWGFLLVSVGITLTFLTGLRSFRTARGLSPFHVWMFSLFLTIFLTKLLFCVVLVLGDLGRLIYGVIRA